MEQKLSGICHSSLFTSFFPPLSFLLQLALLLLARFQPYICSYYNLYVFGGKTTRNQFLLSLEFIFAFEIIFRTK
jgi:hypothetical protein